MDNKIRVRFAPSPTGFLHIGSARTALFNWLFARRYGGVFILRIEDTDLARSTDEFLESQLQDLRWLGLDWEEGPGRGGEHGPYFQSGRLEKYKSHADLLLEKGLAYYCCCAPEDLAEERQRLQEQKLPSGYQGRCKNLSAEEKDERRKKGTPAAIRFIMPKGTTAVEDLVRGRVEFDNSLIEDFVIMKSDGVPTYNFACVVDDRLMEITHVIRGEEHLSNTPKQICLYEAFGYSPPAFAHIPIILNKDRTKLSKRKGAVNLLDFKEKGYLAPALLNFIALLGWAPKDDREKMTLDEIIEAFSLDGITKHPAVFDEAKLEWMNSCYLKELPPDEFIDEALPYLEKAGFDKEKCDREWLLKFAPLYSERIRLLSDLEKDTYFYFNEDYEFDEKAVNKFLRKDGVEKLLSILIQSLGEIETFEPAALEEMVRNLAERENLSAGKFIHPIRVAITGKSASPPLFDVMNLLGRERTLERLKKALKLLEIRV